MFRKLFLSSSRRRPVRRPSSRLHCESLEARQLLSTFTVNTTGDFDIPPWCDQPGFPCSLRSAINRTNANPGPDVIHFSILSGQRTINLGWDLPTITDPVVIDGTTQPGFGGSPLIELNGGDFANAGLVLAAGGSTVRGLVLNRFRVAGIELHLYDNNVIAGNFIGTDTTGTVALGSHQVGVSVNAGSSRNTIGGTTAADRNVISGNRDGGIRIGVGSENLVLGNYIGTDKTSTVAVGNGVSVPSAPGVYLESGAFNNTIGGTTAGEGNVIAGNGHGVIIVGSATKGNKVLGNYIGTNAAFASGLGNGDGVVINNAPGNIIGGTALGAGNVIAGNKHRGVFVWGAKAKQNLVQGNAIGTNAGGMVALGNGHQGIMLAYDAADNTIGGTMNGAGNRIAFNGSAGAYDAVHVVYASTRNALLRNAIYNNAGLGINLGADGVTGNDLGDFDLGDNALQNYPLVTEVTPLGGGTSISGTLNSHKNQTYRVELFSSPDCDPSGQGEGKVFLNAGNVVTDGAGNATFTINVRFSLSSPSVVTATATDAEDNTSEFSPCRPVGAAGPTSGGPEKPPSSGSEELGSSAALRAQIRPLGTSVLALGAVREARDQRPSADFALTTPQRTTAELTLRSPGQPRAARRSDPFRAALDQVFAHAQVPGGDLLE